jgi:DNA-3-methyladenine glycosylase II
LWFQRLKTRYAGELARAITTGALDLAALEHQTDEAVQAALVQIKGIGRWTVDIYLMFSLNRPGVWPAGVLALVVAAQHLLGLPSRPTAGEMGAISEQWRPWRTTAAIMLWQYYHHIKPGAGGEPGRS